MKPGSAQGKSWQDENLGAQTLGSEAGERVTASEALFSRGLGTHGAEPGWLRKVPEKHILEPSITET